MRARIDFEVVINELESLGCGVRCIARLLHEDKSRISRIKNGQEPQFSLGFELLRLRAKRKRQSQCLRNK